jgi:hypothetical protein
MQAQVKSKMKYAGETYHRVAPASVEISKSLNSLLFNDLYRSVKEQKKES